MYGTHVHCRCTAHSQQQIMQNVTAQWNTTYYMALHYSENSLSMANIPWIVKTATALT